MNGVEVIKTSLVDDGTRESKALIYNATMGNNQSLKDLVGDVVNVTEFCLFKEIKDADTGEIIPTEIITLITDQGAITTNSKTVIKSFENICSVFGEPSWKDDPLPIKIISGKTKENRTYMDITPAV
jgi:hypothetical protein